jgi:hypothetical protein
MIIRLGCAAAVLLAGALVPVPAVQCRRCSAGGVTVARELES